MKLKLNKKGSPLTVSMGITKMMDRGIKQPARVKDHSEWRNEPKPWGVPKYPHKSQHSSTEAHYLYRTALELGAGNYANLGVFRGGSVNFIAEGLRQRGEGGKVYGVDLFDTGGKCVNGAETIENLTEVFEERGLMKYVEFCKGYTHEWPERLSHLKFKYIFVDADHYYESVKQDFELWSPLLEPDGLIGFHDTDMNTIDKFLTEDMDGWELVDHVYRIKSFRKKA